MHFFGLRLYIHMVYITVSTSVNISRMFSMTPTTPTVSSQGRWHENGGFWRKTVPSVIMGCHFFLNVLRSRTSRPRRETTGRGWWQMDGFRGELPVAIEAGKYHVLRSRLGEGVQFWCDVPRTTFFARSAEDFENLEKHHKLIWEEKLQ